MCWHCDRRVICFGRNEPILFLSRPRNRFLPAYQIVHLSPPPRSGSTDEGDGLRILNVCFWRATPYPEALASVSVHATAAIRRVCSNQLIRVDDFNTAQRASTGQFNDPQLRSTCGSTPANAHANQLSVGGYPPLSRSRPTRRACAVVRILIFQ